MWGTLFSFRNLCTLCWNSYNWPASSSPCSVKAYLEIHVLPSSTMTFCFSYTVLKLMATHIQIYSTCIVEFFFPKLTDINKKILALSHLRGISGIFSLYQAFGHQNLFHTVKATTILACTIIHRILLEATSWTLDCYLFLARYNVMNIATCFKILYCK